MDSLPIPDSYLRSLQVMHIALGTTALPMIVVALLLQGDAAPTDADFRLINLLSIIHLFIFVGSVTASGILQGRMLQPASELLMRSTTGDRLSAWEQWLQTYKNAHITALAAREGAAIFGMVVIILASMNGTLAAKPLYWANLLSTALFAAHIAMSFPSEGRIRAAATF